MATLPASAAEHDLAAVGAHRARIAALIRPMRRHERCSRSSVECRGGHRRTALASARATQARARTLVLAHGAGAPQTHPWMVTMAEAIAARGIDVVTFNFLYTRGPAPRAGQERRARGDVARGDRGRPGARDRPRGSSSAASRWGGASPRRWRPGRGRRRRGSSCSAIRSIRRASPTSCARRTCRACARRCSSSRARATPSGRRRSSRRRRGARRRARASSSSREAITRSPLPKKPRRRRSRSDHRARRRGGRPLHRVTVTRTRERAACRNAASATRRRSTTNQRASASRTCS